MSTLLFIQGGNNLRLGNTLVWTSRAHDWCRLHGFEFFFPSAPAVLGELLRADSPLFAVPAVHPLAKNDLPAEAPRLHAPALETSVAKLLEIARAAIPRGAEGPSMVSVAPTAVGCLLGLKPDHWESEAVVDFVRSHRLCIVNEPFPFAPSKSGDSTAELFPPSTASRSALERVAGRPGVLVGIHVRQTDYRRWNDGAYFRDNAFYNRLARGALSLLPASSQVFVAHDGEFTAEPALRGDPRVEVSSGTNESTVADFVRFAGCDIIIGPQSTFTIQAMRLGASWLPKPRELIKLQPGHTVDDLLSGVTRALGAHPEWRQ